MEKRTRTDGNHRPGQNANGQLASKPRGEALDQALVDKGSNRSGIGRVLAGGAEIIVRERHGNLGEDLQVRSTSLGLGNKQGDGASDGRLVHGIPSGDALGGLKNHDGSLLDGIGLGMRNREAIDHTRSTLLLSLKERGEKGIGIVSDASGDGVVGNELQRGIAAIDLLVAKDVGRLDESTGDFA